MDMKGGSAGKRRRSTSPNANAKAIANANAIANAKSKTAKPTKLVAIAGGKKQAQKHVQKHLHKHSRSGSKSPARIRSLTRSRSRTRTLHGGAGVPCVKLHLSPEELATTALLVIDAQRDFCMASGDIHADGKDPRGGRIADTQLYVKDAAGNPTSARVRNAEGDLVTNGSLCVSGTERESEMWTEIKALQRMNFGFQVYTKDWHPHNHASFTTEHPGSHVGSIIELPPLVAEGAALSSLKAACGKNYDDIDAVSYKVRATVRQFIWPPHCVQHSYGSELMESWFDGPLMRELIADGKAVIINKAAHPQVDSYSGFGDGATPLGFPKWFDDTKLLETLKERGMSRVVVCGIASDYCVKATAIDAVKYGFQTYVVKAACRGVFGAFPDSAQADVAAAGGQFVENVTHIHTSDGCGCAVVADDILV